MYVSNKEQNLTSQQKQPLHNSQIPACEQILQGTDAFLILIGGY